MQEGPLYGRTGDYLGQVQKSGNTYMLYSATGAFLGQYNESANYTYDAHGNSVGMGNLLGMLVER
jgi:hypothetical protein